MDLRTVMLMLAAGSLLFGLLLVLFQLNRNNPQKVPFWVEAKILQAAGSLMLYFRTSTFDGLTFLANTTLLLGCAYEAWAVRILSGETVKRWVHILRFEVPVWKAIWHTLKYSRRWATLKEP